MKSQREQQQHCGLSSLVLETNAVLAEVAEPRTSDVMALLGCQGREDSKNNPAIVSICSHGLVPTSSTEQTQQRQLLFNNSCIRKFRIFN